MKILGIIFLVIGFAMLIYIFIIGFRFPDMTQTRLFLNNWPLYVFCFLFCITGLVAYTIDD